MRCCSYAILDRELQANKKSIFALTKNYRPFFGKGTGNQEG
jgi:hypothetical protein